MTPWRAAVRQVNSKTLLSKSRIQSPVAVGSRTYLGTRTTHHRVLPERVQALRSRAARPSAAQFDHVNSRQITSLFKSRTSNSWSSSSPPTQGTLLQSAFPTKTFIALLVLGTVAYFAVEIKEHDWTDSLFDSFAGDHGATPLHFYKDRDEVDHWIQHHIPDPSAPLRDPELLKVINDRFHEAAGGWEMSEDDSREFGMPVTHGCRFKSNEPCVSAINSSRMPAQTQSLTPPRKTTSP